jgi:hypothetical protein
MTTAMKNTWAIGTAFIIVLGLLAFQLRIGVRDLAAEKGSGFLLYAPLSDRIIVVQGQGQVPILDSDSRAIVPHRAHPAASKDGSLIAIIRTAVKPHVEKIILYRLETKEESTIVNWPGAIWGVALSSDSKMLAFIADNPSSERHQSLYVLDLSKQEVTELTPDVEWVSNYSVPVWSPDARRIGFETRYTTSDGVEKRTVALVDLQTRVVSTVDEGFSPAWGILSNEISYLSPDGVRCYQVVLANNTKRLLFSHGSFLGQSMIGPRLYAPVGKGMLFNTTSGLKGDGRKTFYVDFESGKKVQFKHEEAFEVVGWWTR